MLITTTAEENLETQQRGALARDRKPRAQGTRQPTEIFDTLVTSEIMHIEPPAAEHLRTALQ